MQYAIVVPHLGATGGDVTLDEWLARPGDFVRAGAPLFSVTTDKASVEVEAYQSGYLRRVLVPAGNQVELGTTIAILADTLDEPVDEALAGDGPASFPSGPQPVSQATQGAQGTPAAPIAGRILASPLARRVARAEGIDLARVAGSGEGGRIVKRDVLAALGSQGLTSQTAPAPVRVERDAPAPATGVLTPSAPAAVRGERAGALRRQPLSAMRRAVGERTQRSKREAPHFYVSSVIDVTDAQALRRQVAALAAEHGWVAPSLTDLAIRAAALALRQTPQLNVSLAGDELICYDEINIGMVIGLAEGMIVPVVPQTDRLNLFTVAATTRRLKQRAADGQLTAADLSGGTFTVSNLGMYGVDSFIAVINPPEPAILALGAARPQPAIWQGQVQPRTLLTATLSADHRVVDGVTAARFMAALRTLLEQPLSLALGGPEEI